MKIVALLTSIFVFSISLFSVRSYAMFLCILNQTVYDVEYCINRHEGATGYVVHIGKLQPSVSRSHAFKNGEQLYSVSLLGGPSYYSLPQQSHLLCAGKWMCNIRDRQDKKMLEVVATRIIVSKSIHELSKRKW